jgi:hypothetical protein
MNGTNTNSCACCGGLLSNGVAALANTEWVISGTADFTGDCNNDILWTMPGTTNVLLWTMEGESLIATNWLPQLSNSASSYGVVGTGDFNGDGKPDLLITNAFDTIIRLMNGTKWIQDIAITNGAPTLNSQMVGVGDFLGNGQSDILWRDYSTGSNYVWMMQGTSLWGQSNYWSMTDLNWQIQGIGDFNGGGKADIVWRHATSGSNVIWLTSSPFGGYTNVVLPQIRSTNWAIAGPK